MPQPAEHNPEQPIEAIQFETGLLPLEDSELLAKSDGFQSEFVAWQEKGTQVSNYRTGKGNHRRILVERHPQAKWCRFNGLILLRDGILMTHTMLLMTREGWLRTDLGKFVLRPFVCWPWSARLRFESV